MRTWTVVAVTMAMLAAGFSLEGTAVQKSLLNRTEVFKTEGLVVHQETPHVKNSRILQPRKR
jgi:hypothetical protein